MNNDINFINGERAALLGFTYFDYLGFKKIKNLRSSWGSYQKAFSAPYNKLLASNIPPDLATKFINWRKSFNFADALESLKKESINFISLIDKEYPLLLKEISSPPLIIFYSGNVSLLSDAKNQRLAIVGSRKSNEYANQVLASIMSSLVKNDITIVSGLAIGTDAEAHQEAIRNKGKTIAVLGTGIDRASFYPLINLELANDIIKNFGLIISEFPPGTKAKPINFPRRNRIISGLCQATLVVQAEKKSGSLITANYSLEQNREVLSIPGSVLCKLSQGTNELIKEGAKVVTDANDILEIYNNKK